MPINSIPSARAHCVAKDPTPPAAAWNSTRVAGGDRGDPAEQVLRRHPLQHRGRGGLEADRVGQLHHMRRAHHPRLGIGAGERFGIGGAVAGARWVTPSPTASITPAASVPSGLGIGTL